MKPNDINSTEILKNHLKKFNLLDLFKSGLNISEGFFSLLEKSEEI